MPIDRDYTRRGFTLPEAVLALVILGMAAAGVLLPFSGGAAAQAEGMHRTLAARLGNDLMERIAATSPENVPGWNGYAEAQGQVKDANDTVFADPRYAGFSREVTCVNNIRVYPQSSSVSAQSGFVVVFVRVYDRGRPVVTLSRLISK